MLPQCKPFSHLGVRVLFRGREGYLAQYLVLFAQRRNLGRRVWIVFPLAGGTNTNILTNIFTNIITLIFTNMVLTASIVASSLPPSKDEHRRSQPLLENLDCTGNLKRSADSVDSVVTFVTTSTLLSYKFSTNLGRCRSPMSRQPWESHPGLHRLAAKRFLVQLRISFQLNCLSPGGRCVHQPKCKLLLQRRG